MIYAHMQEQSMMAWRENPPFMYPGKRFSSFSCSFLGWKAHCSLRTFLHKARAFRRLCRWYACIPTCLFFWNPR